jgi:hypothetical protein
MGKKIFFSLLIVLTPEIRCFGFVGLMFVPVNFAAQLLILRPQAQL